MFKAMDVANFFIGKDDEEMTNLKLQKMLYYAQGFFLAVFDKPLFEDEIEAWTHGPVVPSVYHKFKPFGRSYIQIQDDHNPSFFQEISKQKDKLNLLNEVYHEYGQYSAWRLRELSHEDECWRNHEFDSSIISKDEIKELFKTRIN